jgi:predicted CoA-binding protein
MADPRDILERSRTIAVVGASNEEGKPAHDIPKQLQDAGFTIIPVNPTADEVLGGHSYAALEDVPVPVDAVDVFRPAEEAPQIARAAVAIGARALWLQLRITSDEARAIAEEAGLDYVENMCMGAERRKYGITHDR